MAAQIGGWDSSVSVGFLFAQISFFILTLWGTTGK